MKSVNTESDVLAALLLHYHAEEDGVELFYGMIFFMIVKASVSGTFVSPLRRSVICWNHSHGTRSCLCDPNVFHVVCDS